MRIPTSSERRDFELSAVLYDATDGGRAGVDPIEFLTSTGLDVEDARRWVLDARARDVLTLGDGVVLEARLTAAARQLVELARQRVADRSGRRRLVTARLLAWANAGGTNVEGFEASDHAWADGIRFTFAEAAEAAEILHDAGLVKANSTTAWGGDVVRCDVRILTAGRVCLDDFDGDVRAYQAGALQQTGGGAQQTASSPGVVVNYHAPVVTVTGDRAQLAWNNDTVNQDQTVQEIAPEYVDLAAVVTQVLALLDRLGLSPDDAADVHAEASGVLAEVTRANPDGGVVRRGVTMLKGLLSAAGAGVSTAVTAETTEHARHLIALLASALPG